MTEEDGTPIKELRWIPKYTPEQEGQGLFLKYLWFCIKTAFYTVIALIGGIFVTLGGMLYLVYKLISDLVKIPPNEIDLRANNKNRK